MVKTEIQRRFRMVQVSAKVYDKLMSMKHKLETESSSSWSFSDVIENLVNKKEG